MIFCTEFGGINKFMGATIIWQTNVDFRKSYRTKVLNVNVSVYAIHSNKILPGCERNFYIKIRNALDLFPFGCRLAPSIAFILNSYICNWFSSSIFWQIIEMKTIEIYFYEMSLLSCLYHFNEFLLEMCCCLQNEIVTNSLKLFKIVLLIAVSGGAYQ